VLRAFIRRPFLAIEGLRAAVAVAADGWWRRPPFVPVPDPVYLAWRRETAYGDRDAPMHVDDLVHYLAWRRRYRRLG
jgi:hypothetical protein